MDWNEKVGSQEIPGIKGKFGIEVQKGSRAKANRVWPRERTAHSKQLLPAAQEKSNTHGHHQMANTQIRLITFFAAKMEKLYTVRKNKTLS